MLAGQAIGAAIDETQSSGDAAVPAGVRPDYGIRSQLPSISSCQSAVELRGWLLRFARNLGFYGARYVHVGARWWALGHAEAPLRFMTTSDRRDDDVEDWLVRDPCVMRVRTAFAPFAWSTRTGADLTEVQRTWLERERAHGVAAGVAVPIQDSLDGPAYLSLFGYDEVTVTDLVQEHAPELAFVAAQFHALAKTFIPVADWAPRLSEREIECLRLAALGKTVQESGRTLGLSGRTVEYHLQKASDKLGAETKIRAVVLAFGSGLVRA